MNIFKYINSKDIRKYLEKIDYKFTSLEAAWLIYQCKGMTLKEKQAAFNELIDTMPDCEIEKRNNTVPQKSLHKFLKKYISLENRYIAEFYSAQNSIYKLEYIFKDDCEWYADGLYSSFQDLKAVAEATENVVKIRCEKLIPNQTHSRMIACFSKDFEIIDIHIDYIPCNADYDIYYGVFGGLFFDFPTPFKKGDIVCDKFNRDGVCGGPFVLTEIGLSRFKDEKAVKKVRRQFRYERRGLFSKRGRKRLL